MCIRMGCLMSFLSAACSSYMRVISDAVAASECLFVLHAENVCILYEVCCQKREQRCEFSVDGGQQSMGSLIFRSGSSGLLMIK